MLVLKRLSDARRDGDRILAVLRGSAVNQDGRSQGLTAPNGPSQQRVVQRALAVSGLVPDDIDAMEAHGTGTSLGDPIEAGALAEVFGPTRREDRPLWLGSSKSNIGHAQAAAGILGVIKMVLALERERLPKTLYVDEPSPHVAWQGSGLALLGEPRPWAREAGRVRRAGVSSFGISGTNAHVVLEEAPREVAVRRRQPREPSDARLRSRKRLARYRLLCLAVTKLRCARRRGAGRRGLGLHPQADLGAVVRTAAVNRTHFDARAAIQADDIGQAQEALAALAQGRAHPAVSTGTARPLGGVVLVFPGHGSQWPGMGRALLAESAVFADAIAACDAALLPHTGWSVRAVLGGEDGAEVPPLDRVDVVQPVLFAMAIGLAAVWRSLGVRPDAVVGHSVGEIAAAVSARALSLEDGARLVALRGKLIAAACGAWRHALDCAGGGGGAAAAGAVDGPADPRRGQCAGFVRGVRRSGRARSAGAFAQCRRREVPSGGHRLCRPQRAHGRHPRSVPGRRWTGFARGGHDPVLLVGDGRASRRHPRSMRAIGAATCGRWCSFDRELKTLLAMVTACSSNSAAIPPSRRC